MEVLMAWAADFVSKLVKGKRLFPSVEIPNDPETTAKIARLEESVRENPDQKVSEFSSLMLVSVCCLYGLYRGLSLDSDFNESGIARSLSISPQIVEKIINGEVPEEGFPVLDLSGERFLDILHYPGGIAMKINGDKWEIVLTNRQDQDHDYGFIATKFKELGIPVASHIASIKAT